MRSEGSGAQFIAPHNKLISHAPVFPIIHRLHSFVKELTHFIKITIMKNNVTLSISILCGAF